jgi:hypothetical protein
LGSHVADSQRWLDRREARRWPAARQGWRGRHGSDSGEVWVSLSHHVRVGAQVGARENLRVAGWLRARAEQQDHRRRQWRAAVGGWVARAREEK